MTQERDRVVLCEGKRDVRLVEQFYELEYAGVEVDRFLAEDVDHQRVRNFERRKLQNFTERRNPYDVLVKSENGVENLEFQFAGLCNVLLKQPDYEVCLLTDLDKKNYDHLTHGSDIRKYRELLKQLDERIQSVHEGRAYEIEWSDPHAKTSVQVAGEATLHSKQGPVGSFDVLAFRSDLEEASDIRDGDRDETEGDKLRSFLASADSRAMTRVL
ncbi:hypothetical protein [Halobaculum sp. MBLA0143]|uniref:hypothetical protein n=1 Tax=Halobaculum sp. MBLA0143 TaxID=3079933 RepID=UPI003524B560